MRKINFVLLVYAVISCLFTACFRKAEFSAEEENTSKSKILKDTVAQTESILYNGDLIAEYERNKVIIQERFLNGSFRYSDVCYLVRFSIDKNYVPNIYDTIDSKNCIYTLSDDEKVTITGFLKEHNLETQEVNYWVKGKVNETEGWIFLYTTNKPNHYFFENDFWVPYKKYYKVDGVDHEYIIRNISSGARLRFSTSLKTYPDQKAPDSGVININPNDNNDPIYVGVVGMTVNQDFDSDKDYTKTWFLIERDDVSGWVPRRVLDHGEMGGHLFHGPIEEIKHYLGMGA